MLNDCFPSLSPFVASRLPALAVEELQNAVLATLLFLAWAEPLEGAGVEGAVQQPPSPLYTCTDAENQATPTSAPWLDPSLQENDPARQRDSDSLLVTLATPL